MEALIQIRRGTAAQWVAANPTLASGEPGLETDTGKGKYGKTGVAWIDLPYAWSGSGQTASLLVACSDESTALTAGTAKVTFRMPYTLKLTAARASLSTASSSGLVTVDINEGGASIFSTPLTIDASEKTSTTAATPAVLGDLTLADDSEMTVDIDGAGTGAKGLKITLIGNLPP